MTSNSIAKLVVALNTFKMVPDDKFKYPSIRAEKVGSVFVDGKYHGGVKSTDHRAGWNNIAYHPLAGVDGGQLVVFRSAGGTPEQTSFGVYSYNVGEYSPLSIEEVLQLFTQYVGKSRSMITAEVAASVIASAAGKLSLVHS